MITPVKDSVARRLVLARDALMEAQQLVINSKVDLNLMRAVWQADFALELALPAFYDHQSWSHPAPKMQNNKVFSPGLTHYLSDLQENEAKNDQRFSYFIDLARKVHEARNDIQHRGIVFSSSTATGFTRDAKEFFNELSIRYLGVTTDKLNLSILNSDLEAQKHFDEAIKYFEEENYGKSAREISIAYNTGYDNLLYRNNDLIQRGFKETRDRRIQYLEGQISDIFWQDSANSTSRDSVLGKAIFAIIKPLGITQFGVDLNTAIRFFNLLPGVFRSLGGTTWFDTGQERSYKKEEVEFIFDQSILILHRIRVYLDE
jgi:hypothetical protein